MLYFMSDSVSSALSNPLYMDIATCIHILHFL